MREESPFINVPVRQHVGAFIESDWKLSQKHERFIRENRARVIQTQVVEDGGCRQSKDAQKGGMQKRGKEKAFEVLIRKKISGKVHDFDEVQLKGMPYVRNPVIPPEIYKASAKQVKKEEIDFSHIIGSNASSKFTSFSADNQAKPIMTMDLLEDRRKRAVEGDRIQKHWYAATARPGRMVIRRSTEAQWFLVLGDVCAVSVACIEVEVDTSHDGAFIWWVNIGNPNFCVVNCFIYDIEEWKAAVVEWTSPIALFLRFGKSRFLESARMQLTLWSEDGPDDFLKALARAGWLDLKLTALRQVHKDRVGECLPGSDMWDVSWSLTSATLGTDSEEMILKCMSKKSSQYTYNEDGFQELEGAYYVLDNDERDDAVEQTVKHKEMKASFKEYQMKCSAKKKRAQERRGGGPRV